MEYSGGGYHVTALMSGSSSMWRGAWDDPTLEVGWPLEQAAESGGGRSPCYLPPLADGNSSANLFRSLPPTCPGRAAAREG